MDTLCHSLDRLSLSEVDEHFAFISVLSSMRSKDPCTQVGACIVDNNNNLVGIGYNGMPHGCDDDKFPWGKHTEDPMDDKHLYVCHAEANAIFNSHKSVKNSRMYVTLFPCNECAKVIIQTGVKEIIYLMDKHKEKKSSKAARRMFDSAGVQYRQFHSQKSYEISLSNQ